MKLSIVIPVYNEVDTIEIIIDRVKESKVQNEIVEKEIVLIDDFSSDGTREFLSNLNDESCKVYFHEKNLGKGAAIKTGISQFTGDILVIQDADLEYDPNEYSKLLEPMISSGADVVYGSRFLSSGPHRVLYFWHSIANSMLTFCSNMFSDLNLTDMETCYKVFRREIITSFEIEESRFGLEPEITAKIAEQSRIRNIKIFEIGISYYGRTYEEGKKIGLKDAFRAIYCIVKYNNSNLAIFMKYGIGGILVAASQIISLYLLKSQFFVYLENNVAHFLSMVVSLFVGYQIHSKFSWKQHRPFLVKRPKRILSFLTISTFSIVVRLVCFFLLNRLGIDYMANACISISLAIGINFLGYDKIVFKTTKN